MGAHIITKFPSSVRMVLFILMSLYIPTVYFSFQVFDFDAVSYVLDMFGKEKTLTGRTDLWEFGFNFAQNSPILGIGYNAFWVRGRSEAEYLWEIFYIASRTGFHFHNLYIQTFVDLGIVGLGIVVLMQILFFIKSLRKVCIEGSSVQSIFLFGISSVLLSRSFVEVDILNPFGLGPLLFYSCYSMAILDAYRQSDIKDVAQGSLNCQLITESKMERNKIYRKEDCTYIGLDTLTGKYIIREQLFPESRGWLEHTFDTEEEAVAALK